MKDIPPTRPGPAASTGLAIGIDLSNGHIGLIGDLAGGIGMGLSAGPSITFGLENTVINGNDSIWGTVTNNRRIGIDIPIGGASGTLNQNNELSGGGMNIGIVSKHGQGPGGAYHQWGQQWTYDVSSAVIQIVTDAYDAIKSGIERVWPKSVREWQ